MEKVLSKNFFARKTLIVAEDLLGKFLVRKVGGKKKSFLIREVEAYDGLKDLASHASRGMTIRNAPMFGEAGHFYVYFTYGMHWMLNVVTGEKNYPAAILIRGAGNINGPGKLTKSLGITKFLNGKKARPGNGLWFEDHLVKIKKSNIIRTARVGVLYAGPIWSKKHYRFLLKK